MRTSAARSQYSGEVLFVAFELSRKSWKLGFATALGQKVRERTVEAWDLGRLEEEIRRAKERFGLPRAGRVVSCYEAGREGFSLHRYLEAGGVENAVVDPASVEVSRRARRVKTDRVDLGTLLRRRIRSFRGEEGAWSVVRVPSVKAEDQRQLHRELRSLKSEKTRHSNRIQGLLATQGVRVEMRRDFVARLRAVRLWDGSPLPEGLRARLEREWGRLQLVRSQIRELEAERREQLQRSRERSVERARRLMRLRGIGVNGGWVLAMELFGWRQFRNRRELGGLVGLTPTPYRSGEMVREQGISKAGTRWVRPLLVELAWRWLQYQPDSELSRWYQRRYGGGTRRARRVGIVALARKLLVALWQYVESGVLPEGAELKA